jgi:hypothetical protein
MSPLVRDAVWAFLSFNAFLAGIATAIFYCLKIRLATLRREPRSPKRPEVYRSELPTLTNLHIERTVGHLARKCRQEGIDLQ